MKRMCRWQEWKSPFCSHLRDENTGTSVHKSQLGHLTCQQVRATENPPERRRAVNHAMRSSHLWGAVGVLCPRTYGKNMESSCTFRPHGAYHSSMQTWLPSLPQLSTGLEQPSGSKWRYTAQPLKDQACVPNSGGMGWDQFLSFPVLF